MDKVEDKTQSKPRDGLDFDEEENGTGGLKKARVSEPDLSYWEQQPPVAEVKIDTEPPPRSASKAKSREKLKYYLSVGAVVVTLICIWIVFVIPHLCYFHVGICTSTGSKEEELQPINLVVKCSGFQYDGTECLNYFGACPNSPVNVSEDQTLEADIATLFFILDTQKLSETCEPEKEMIREFVCQYSYQPCDSSDNIILPSRNVCEHIRDSACQSEWSILLNGQNGRLLPRCGELPLTVPEPNCSRNFTISPSSSMPKSSSNSTPSSEKKTLNTTADLGNCSNIMYTGTACSNHLGLCPGSQTNPSVNSFDTTLDNSLSNLFSLFGFSTEQSCKQSQSSVEEFLCQAAFPPCDDKLFTHTPNRTLCEYIRDQLCPKSWMALESNPLLPNCSNFPIHSIEPSCTVNSTTSSSDSPIHPTPSLVSLSLHCNEDNGFFLYITDDEENEALNNTCQARCSKWHNYESQTHFYVRDGVLILFTVIGVIGAVCVIFFSIIRHERMLIFPSVFIVYGTFPLLILGLVIIVQFTYRNGLSCAPDDLVYSTTRNPTVFCTFSGFVYYWSILTLTYWWFMHVSSTFWKVMYPFHARNHEDKGKYINIVCFLLGLVIPAIPPTIVLFIDGYVVNGYPPILCLPRNTDISYYGLVLPVSLSLCIGITFLVFVLHAILQKRRLFHFRQSKSHLFGLSTAEKKLLIVFTYYLILGCVGITGFSFASAVFDSVFDSIETSLECESFRTDPDYECPRDFENIRTAIYLVLATYILLGLYPALNLVFAVNKNEVKFKFVSWFPSMFTESFRTSTLSTTMMMNGQDTPFALRRRLTYNFSTTDYIKSSQEMATIGRSGVYLPKEQDV